MATSWLLILNTLYIIFHIAFLRPPNLFTALSLPLTAPVPIIRGALRAVLTANDVTLPSHLLNLLTRFNAYDARVLYVRLGHDVMVSCEHCTQAEDYMISALPAHLLSYTLCIILIGLLTSRPFSHRLFFNPVPNHAQPQQAPWLSRITGIRIRRPEIALETLRKTMVGALVAGMVAEAGYKITGEVKFDERAGPYAGSVRTDGAFWGLLPFGWDGKSGGVVMWHDVLLLLRLTSFLLLPLLTSLLSPPSPTQLSSLTPPSHPSNALMPPALATPPSLPPTHPLSQLFLLQMAAAEGARSALTGVGALRTMGRAVGRGALRERVRERGEWEERVGGSVLDGAWEDVDDSPHDADDARGSGGGGVWEAWTDFVRAKGGYPFQTDVPPPKQQALLPPSEKAASEQTPASSSATQSHPHAPSHPHPPSLPRRPTNKRRKSRRHHNRRKSATTAGGVGAFEAHAEDDDEARAESALRGRAGEVVGRMLGMLGIGVGVGGKSS